MTGLNIVGDYDIILDDTPDAVDQNNSTFNSTTQFGKACYID